MTNHAAIEESTLVAFGEAVRVARERSGKRVGEFSREAGISRHTLRKVESGRGAVSNYIYWRIANALELDPTPVLRAGAA